MLKYTKVPYNFELHVSDSLFILFSLLLLLYFLSFLPEFLICYCNFEQLLSQQHNT